MATAMMGEMGWHSGLRWQASITLLLHLVLVGVIPMGEAVHIHVHDHAPGPEWHTDGSLQHDDKLTGDCHLCFGTTTPSVVALAYALTHDPRASQLVDELDVDVSRLATSLKTDKARGPPAG